MALDRVEMSFFWPGSFWVRANFLAFLPLSPPAFIRSFAAMALDRVEMSFFKVDLFGSAFSWEPRFGLPGDFFCRSFAAGSR